MPPRVLFVGYVFACHAMRLTGQPAAILPQPGPFGATAPAGMAVNGRMGERQFATNCSADGVVVNAVTGEPVPRARVALGGTIVVADSGGRFQAQNISCAPVQPIATRPGFVNNMQSLAGPFLRNRLIAPEPGGATHDLRISLTPQAVITGVITDDQGDPVMGAQVSVMSSRILAGRRTFQQTSVTNTNDLGEFRHSTLPAGKYIICARANLDFSAQDPRGSLSSGEKCYPGPLEGGIASTFDLPAGREMRIPLSLPAVPILHVRGTVAGAGKSRNISLSLVRRGMGAPIAGSNRGTAIQPDGKFDIGGVAPGSYTVSADYWEENGRYTARLPVDVGNSNVEGLTIALTQAFAVNGVVRVEGTDATLPPRQQLSLALRSSEPMAGGARITWGAEGNTFTMADMTPGTYRLESYGNGNFYIKRAMYNGRDISREDAAINQPGGVVEVVLGTDTGSIEGVVSDREGMPAPAWIMIVEDGRAPRISNATDAGTFRTPALAPGAYTVYAWDDINQVEYANPDWMRRNGGGEKVTIEAGQKVQVKLVRKEVAAQ